jgi:signal peptidase II
MIIGEDYEVFRWFHIHFVENDGMAFGIELGGEYGKLVLSLFRIVAVSFIGYFLYRFIKEDKVSTGLVASIALILAGALGNIIDSTFYGLLFSESYGTVAQFMPEQGGYQSIFYGRVVDMLYFPLYQGYWPQWMPWVGGDYFIFFRPVFNIADSAITLGVLSILIFQRSLFDELDEATKPQKNANDVNENAYISASNTTSNKIVDEGTPTTVLNIPNLPNKNNAGSSTKVLNNNDEV